MTTYGDKRGFGVRYGKGWPVQKYMYQKNVNVYVRRGYTPWFSPVTMQLDGLDIILGSACIPRGKLRAFEDRFSVKVGRVTIRLLTMANYRMLLTHMQTASRRISLAQVKFNEYL